MCSVSLARSAATSRSAESLTVELFSGEEIPRGMVERAAALDSRSPFAGEVWWDAWWHHLRPPEAELFLLTVSRGDQLLGLAPWYMRRTRGYGRVVRFLGDSACTDYTTISTAPGHENEVRREIARWIAAEAGRSWDMFILTGVAAGDPLMGPLADDVRGGDVLLDQRMIGNTWRLALPPTWEEYVGLYSKRDRYRLRRVKVKCSTRAERSCSALRVPPTSSAATNSNIGCGRFAVEARGNRACSMTCDSRRSFARPAAASSSEASSACSGRRLTANRLPSTAVLSIKGACTSIKPRSTPRSQS